MAATRPSDVPSDRRAELSAGVAESTNLAECLAVDFGSLLHAVAPSVELSIDPDQGITRRMEAAGRALLATYGLEGALRFAGHASDTVRGWAAYAVGGSDLPLDEQLDRVRPFAVDAHFGVREWAWLAVRPALARDLERGLRLLTSWTQGNAFERRFASELTRPRGVWCAHIPALKQRPELGLPILEPLRADPEAYVQDSVANWLNDAGKSQPEWVQTITASWLEGDASPATQRICRRATRNLS